MGVSEKRQNFHFGVEYPFKVKKYCRCETIRNHLVSSATILQNCNLPGVSRSAMCLVLRDFSCVKNPKKLHLLNKNTMLKYEIHED